MERIEKGKVIPNNKEITIKFSRGIRNKIVPDGRKEERFYFNAKAGDKIIIKRLKQNNKIVRIL